MLATPLIIRMAIIIVGEMPVISTVLVTLIALIQRMPCVKINEVFFDMVDVFIMLFMFDMRMLPNVQSSGTRER